MIRLAFCLICCLIMTPASATEAGWALLREGGKVVLLRHAAAPGTGDPANFDIEKCGTQRNLSDRGKQQAEKIGALIAARAGDPERVLTSRYCRCRDTARIAFENTEIEEFEPLNRISRDPAEAAAANAQVVKEITDFSGSGNMVLVSHNENIRALAGVSPREGEAVIVAPGKGGGLRVLARIIFN